MITPSAARCLAETAHAGQLDRLGRPFLDHVVRVAANPTVSDDAALVVLALLHDSVEKGRLVWDDLRAHGVDDDQLAVLDALTQRAGESEGAYFARIARTPTALLIKRADLLDKLDADPVGVSAREVVEVRSEAQARLDLLDWLTAAVHD
jgi:(p)ppGpp synthase/HD superfamily hydrolase